MAKLQEDHTCASSPGSPYSQISTDEKQFRLLHLQQGSWKDGLRCTLEVISLEFDAYIRYEALSYTWGASTRGEKVLIDGKHINITDNLADALRHLRRSGCGRTLWIDAICIDQHNLDERAQQVRIMGRIYAQAACVLVWLGRGASEPGVPPLVEDRPPIAYTDDVYAELDFAIRNTNPSWWDRVWIVQEVVLAQNIQVHFGRFNIPWDAFCKDFLKMNLGRRGPPSFASPISTIATREAVITRLKALRGLRELYRRRCSFEQVVNYTNKASCSDPRDKVFGILSILPPEYAENVKPDYERSPQEVFALMTSAAIRINANLEILRIVSLPKSLDLPSWALDFTRVNGTNVVDMYGFGGMECDVKVRKLAQCPSPSNHNVNVDLGQLVISGILFDNIVTSRSQVWNEDGETSIKAVVGTLALALESLNSLPAFDAFHNAPLRHDGRRLEENVQARLYNFLANYGSGKHALVEILDEAFELWQSILSLSIQIPPHKPFLGSDVMRFLQYANTAALRRGAVCFSTSNGIIGLAPNNIVPGDIVALLQGSRFPVALRPRENGCFEFRGLAFINGIMFGELLKLGPDAKFEHRDFTLC